MTRKPEALRAPARAGDATNRQQRSRIDTYPLMEHLGVAVVLATIGGCLNVWALMNAGTFATSQSGNIVASALYLATGDWQHFLVAWGSVVCFSLGVFLAGRVIFRTHKIGVSYSAWILGAEAVAILAVSLLWALQVIPTTLSGARTLAFVIAFIAGIQGPSFRTVDGTTYSSVAISTELQGLLATLAQPAASIGITRPQRRALIRRYSLTLGGFAAGGFVTGWLGTLGGWSVSAVRGDPVSGTGWSLLLPACLSFILAGIAFHYARSKTARVDPVLDNAGLERPEVTPVRK